MSLLPQRLCRSTYTGCNHVTILRTLEKIMETVTAGIISGTTFPTDYSTYSTLTETFSIQR